MSKLQAQEHFEDEPPAYKDTVEMNLLLEEKALRVGYRPFLRRDETRISR